MFAFDDEFSASSRPGMRRWGFTHCPWKGQPGNAKSFRLIEEAMSARKRLAFSIAIVLASTFLLHCAPGSVVLVDCGLSLDDTQEIQTALDSVAEGGWVIFPDTTGGSSSIEIDILNECRISQAIQITRSVNLIGGIHGRTEIQRMDIFSLSGTHLAGTIFHVTSSGVSIFSMALTGAEYGNVQRRNTHGIWVQSVAPDPRI